MARKLAAAFGGDKPTQPALEWSPYQQAIFDEVTHGAGNLVVLARAGSGKTTVLVEALRRLPPTAGRVLMCAFNKSIKTELESRAPRNVEIRTLHSLGYKAHRMNFRGQVQLKQDKLNKIVREMIMGMPVFKDFRDNRELFGELAGGIVKLTSLAKNTLASEFSELMELCVHFALDSKGMPPELLTTGAEEALSRCVVDTSEIDFDDMVWLPWRMQYGVNGKPIDRYDTIFVDEVQDLNAAQLWMLKHMLRPGGRMIVVGDERQAIYQFRGADHHAVSRMIRELDAKVLKLPISYRCPTSVVELAQTIVEDLEPAPGAKEGEVTDVDLTDLREMVQPGDFVLSRTNAPLMGVCLDLLANHVPATVAGRDIGKSLLKMVDKSDATDMEACRRWLLAWFEHERDLYADKKPGRVRVARDKVQCLYAIMERCTSMAHVREVLGKLFSDGDMKHKVVCSTVHKAKGLERPKVWMLKDTFFQWGEDISEENVWYVCVTRAQESLLRVSTAKGGA